MDVCECVYGVWCMCEWSVCVCVLYGLLYQLQYYEVSLCAMSALQNINIVLFALLSFYFLNQKGTGYFFLALFFAFIGTFSSGNGMFIFMAGLLILFTRKGDYLYKLVWLLIMSLCVYWYFQNYDSNPAGIAGGYSNKSLSNVLTQEIFEAPDKIMAFFVSFVGSSFSFMDLNNHPNYWGIFLSAVMGFSFILYSLYLLQIKYFQQNPILVAFLWFLIASALSVALSRYQLTHIYALAPRYHLYSLLILITLYMASIEAFKMNNNIKIAYLSIFLGVIFYIAVFQPHYNLLQTYAQEYIFGAKNYHQFESANCINQEVRIVIKEFKQPNSKKFKLATSGKSQSEAVQLLQMADRRNIFKMPYKPLSGEFYPKPLPRESDSVKLNLIIIDQRESFLLDNSWAFIQGEDASHLDIYLLFQSDSNRYIYPTEKVIKTELDQTVGSKNYPNASFKAEIPKLQMAGGVYRIGVVFGQGKQVKGFKFSTEKISIRKIAD